MKRVPREFLNAILVVLGILSASMGLHGFLLSSNFIDGGVTGVSMLLSAITGWCASQGALADDVQVARRSLEDVFLELTGRELRS